MARRTSSAEYEFCSPQVGKGREPDSPYDAAVAAKEIFERVQCGWEFLQIYVVMEPVNAYMGKELRSTVYALFRKEKG
jgi:hypothetical protein